MISDAKKGRLDQALGSQGCDASALNEFTLRTCDCCIECGLHTKAKPLAERRSASSLGKRRVSLALRFG